MFTMNELGKRIKTLRKKAGLTQVEFSKRVGVGLRFIRDLEQGKASVRLDKVVKVLAFLGHHLEIVPNYDKKRISERSDPV
jgi:y4mF family transcriptional regulator